MPKKDTSIDDLARMVKEGFDEMQQRFVTKDDFKILVDEIRLLRADFRDVKITAQSLSSIAGTHEREIHSIKTRLDIVS